MVISDWPHRFQENLLTNSWPPIANSTNLLSSNKDTVKYQSPLSLENWGIAVLESESVAICH